METGSNLASTALFKKTIHLRPDNDKDALSTDYRTIVNVSRQSVELVKVNSEHKAVELAVFEFPFATDNSNWGKCIATVLESAEYSELTNENHTNFYLTDNQTQLVPTVLFSEQKMERQFELLFGTQAETELYHHTLDQLDCGGVYSVPKSISTFLNKDVKSGYLTWVNSLAEKAAEAPTAYLAVQDTRFALVVFQNGRLVFSNWFDFQKPEDLLYYLMAALESLNILHSEALVVLYGNISKDDKLHLTIKKFISKIKFGARPKNLTYSYSFNEFDTHRCPFLFAAACE